MRPRIILRRAINYKVGNAAQFAMRILIVTGDRNFGPGNPRFELQKKAAEDLAAEAMKTLQVGLWGK